MNILITGASSNIGYYAGINLAKLGHFVYFTVHQERQLSSLKERLKKENLTNVNCFKLDITNEIDCKKILELDLDCLINNAAIGVGGSLLELPISILKKNFQVNVFSTLRLSQIFAADLFLKNKKGKIVFISSLAGIVPISFLGSYCMTKSCIITMATVLKKELRLINKSISIKLIEPGIYNTGFNDLMIEDKLVRKSLYFKDLENITLKQKKLFHLFGKDDLTSVSNKVVTAVLDESNRFVYMVPFFQGMVSKLYYFFRMY